MKLNPSRLLEMLRAAPYDPDTRWEDLRTLLQAALERPGYEVVADYLADLGQQTLAQEPLSWPLVTLAHLCLPHHPRAIPASALLDAFKAQGTPSSPSLHAMALLGRAGAMSAKSMLESLSFVVMEASDVSVDLYEEIVTLAVVTLGRASMLDQDLARDQVAMETCRLMRGAPRWGMGSGEPSVVAPSITEAQRAQCQILFTSLKQRLESGGRSYVHHKISTGYVGRRWEVFGSLSDFAKSASVMAAVEDMASHRQDWDADVTSVLAERLWREAAQGLVPLGITLRAARHGIARSPVLTEDAQTTGEAAELALAEALANAETLLRLGERTSGQQLAISVLEAISLRRDPMDRRQAGLLDWAQRVAYPRALL